MYGDLWAKDFGNGLTRDKEKAHDFTPDEAFALASLYREMVPDDGNAGDIVTLNRPPSIKAGDDMVWVQYNGCWFAAERQALFLGTRKALERRA